jgi:hypothetical protein
MTARQVQQDAWHLTQHQQHPRYNKDEKAKKWFAVCTPLPLL